MNFHISDEQVRRDKRKNIYQILFLAFLSAALILKLANSANINEWFLPLVGLFVFAPPIRSLYRRIKEGAGAYPVIELDEPNGKLSVHHKDITVIVSLSLIENLRLQYKSGRLISVLLKTSAGESLRFEGYENLTTLSAALERMTSQENITNASLYHR